MVDERQRAYEGLKQSLRLAAAGEMAGAIAHEVNQPLTALTNYGRSGQLLIQAGSTAELSVVIEKMLAEAQRASEVVRRLRNFFREGTTRLERVPVDTLLASARLVGSTAGNGLDITFSATSEPGLPDLFIDKLQIELVMRNLVVNAVEAIAAHPHPGPKIALHAKRYDAQHVRIVVADSGPGIPQDQRERLFEPFVSGKPTGMGLGLAVSRAIVQAHGGALESLPGPHGEFQLLLPLEPHAQH